MTLQALRTACVHCFSAVITAISLTVVPHVTFAQAPGGFIENPINVSSITEPLLSQTTINSFLPQRGLFTFPAPYNTQAIRLTNASDCGGADCVDAIGYAYWRNINNHAGQNTMLIMVGLDRNKGGQGLTLLQLDKTTNALTNLGPVFDANSPYGWASGEGWYFSATLPTKMYLNTGSQILRYDVLSKQFQTVVDINTKMSGNYIVHQIHSSSDDRVHSATVRDATTYAMLGCMAYEEDTARFHYYAAVGDYDECQIDKSGRWLVIKENYDGLDGEDNVIIDLTNESQRVLTDRAGAGGHSDLGFGYMVASDNWASQSNSQKVWDFTQGTLTGVQTYANNNWNAFTPSHVSHANAKAGVAANQQYACGSSANRDTHAEANDIVCFRLDGSGASSTLVVAPVMTNLDTRPPYDDYDNSPKGNLDVTGQYFIWTSNMGGARLDAFLVKVPYQLLMGGTTPPPADTTAPVLSGISASLITSVSASIAWTTNEAANGSIDYGTTSTYGSSLSLGATLGTTHVQSVSGLTPNTLYHYRVKSTDAAGNTATSADLTFTTLALVDLTAPTVAITAPTANANVSGTVTVTANATDNVGVASVQFRLGNTNLGAAVTRAPWSVSWNTTGLTGSQTLTAIARDAAGNATTSAAITVTANKKSVSADTSAPVQSGVNANGISASTAQINWTTNEAAQDMVDYGTTTAYGTSTAISSTYTTTHAVALASLNASTLYHYRVRSRDAAGNVATSGDFTFTTAAASTLQGQWELDGGTVATDVSGFNRNGTLYGSPQWITGVTGNALSLNGTTDYVEVPHAAALDSYPLTVSLWVKTNTTGQYSLVNKYLPGSMNGYQVFINNGSLCAWYFRDASNNIWDGTNCTLSTNGVTDNRWHHVAFVVDATGGTLYVDGVQTAQRAWTGTAGAATTTQPLSLGRYPGTATQYLPGVLDAVRVYSRSYSAAEISSYYNSVPKPSAGAQAVTWTSLVNVTATGTTLQKTAGCDGCADAGAVSADQLVSGNGYVEFTATVESQLRFLGLTGINSTNDAVDLRYSLRLQNGVAEVREAGVYTWDTTFVAGDVFRIAVENGSVSYAKNGVAFYTSAVAPVYPLRADAVFYSLGGTIQNAKLATGTP